MIARIKQAYATSKYGLKAWEPLQLWLYGNPDETDARLERLNQFNKTDTEFHTVVGKCLWILAQGANHPWGVGALLPRGYSDVSITKKVMCNLRIFARQQCLMCVRVFFF